MRTYKQKETHYAANNGVSAVTDGNEIKRSWKGARKEKQKKRSVTQWKDSGKRMGRTKTCKQRQAGKEDKNEYSAKRTRTKIEEGRRKRRTGGRRWITVG